MLPEIRQERLICNFTELTTGSAESLDERRVADYLTNQLQDTRRRPLAYNGRGHYGYAPRVSYLLSEKGGTL